MEGLPARKRRMGECNTIRGGRTGMEKRMVLTAANIALLAVIVFSSQAEAGDIYGCYKKQNGQLRIVTSQDECLSSEYPIVFNGNSGGSGGQVGKLACVTGRMSYPPGSDANIIITNQKNVNVSDWSEVFHAQYFNPPDEISWGLFCKDEWINTGCSQHIDTALLSGQEFDLDIDQYANGCFSDDEEKPYLELFITCCKIM